MNKIHFALPAGFAALLFVAGCTTSYKTVQMGNNVNGYHIYCGGQIYAETSDCFERASDICGHGGFTVLEEGEPAYGHHQSMWDLTTHDILIRCNKPNVLVYPARKKAPAAAATKPQ